MTQPNPYSAPPEIPEPNSPVPMQNVFARAGAIYVRGWPYYLGLSLGVWVPLELLSSYLEAFVFEPDDFGSVLKLAILLENTFGAFVTAATLAAAWRSMAGETIRPGNALLCGLLATPRVIAANVVSGLAIAVAFVAFVIPAIYLSFRYLLTDAAAVIEGCGPVSAMNRSMQLTRGRLAQVAPVGVAIGVGSICIPLLCSLPELFFPELENWVAAGLLTTVSDVARIYFVLCFLCLYDQLRVAEDSSSISDSIEPDSTSRGSDSIRKV